MKIIVGTLLLGADGVEGMVEGVLGLWWVG